MHTFYISDYNARSLRMIVGVNSVTGNSKWKETQKITVYPNPIKSEFKIDGLDHNKIESIRLIGMQGKSMDLDVDNNSEMILLDRSEINSGQYILEIISQDKYYYSDIILN